MGIEDDLFKGEEDFFCSICGKKLRFEEEIIEEICHDCLSSFLEDKDTYLDTKTV